MAVREILINDNPRLRLKSKAVKNIDSRIITLLADMAETMYNANGVGLAAPQVGVLKRIVVIDVGEGLVELINPVIAEKRGCNLSEEGCLSLPERSGVVPRPDYVKVFAENRSGSEIVVEGDGLMARALCHEIDHLEGILYTDKVVAENMDALSESEISEIMDRESDE